MDEIVIGLLVVVAIVEVAVDEEYRIEDGSGVDLGSITVVLLESVYLVAASKGLADVVLVLYLGNSVVEAGLLLFL